jgi:hypothetical protein
LWLLSYLRPAKEKSVMQTTTLRITRQEFETILVALRIFQDNGDLVTEKENMLQWYQDNEEFILLDGVEIDDLIHRINTSNYGPRCIICGWDATCAFGSTSNSYCDLCKDHRDGAQSQIEPRPATVKPSDKSGRITKGVNRKKLDTTIDNKQQIELCLMGAAINLGSIDKEQVAKIEVYGTDLEDAGADYCEYRFYDKENNLLGSRREMGY